MPGHLEASFLAPRPSVCALGQRRAQHPADCRIFLVVAGDVRPLAPILKEPWSAPGLGIVLTSAFGFIVQFAINAPACACGINAKTATAPSSARRDNSILVVIWASSSVRIERTYTDASVRSLSSSARANALACSSASSLVNSSGLRRRASTSSK